jgi:hypothetical protein
MRVVDGMSIQKSGAEGNGYRLHLTLDRLVANRSWRHKFRRQLHIKAATMVPRSAISSYSSR